MKQKIFYLLLIGFIIFNFVSLIFTNNILARDEGSFCSDYKGTCQDARNCDTTLNEAITGTDCEDKFNGWGVCCVPKQNNTLQNNNVSQNNSSSFHIPIIIPTTFDDFFKKIVNLVLYIAPIIALFVLMYGAFLFITSKGDSKKIEQAKKIITWAIIGLLAVFLAYSIKTLIVKFFTE